MAFSDMDAGYVTTFAPSSVRDFDSSAVQDMDLGNFLSRPVLIDTVDWDEGSQLRHNFNPWTLFCSNTPIKKKLDNYGLMRFNLHIKVIISASPFYYGLGMVSYNPMPEMHDGPSIIIGGNEQLVTYSQRPKFLLVPATSTGGEMVLPFYYDQNWLRNDYATIGRMGTIDYDSFTVLRSANGTPGANVTIRCYAWAENVEISAPTMQLQGKRSKGIIRKKKLNPGGQMFDKISTFGRAKDEYGSGPVSGVASAVAEASHALSDIPVIGPFARATEIGAGTFSRIAAWFGYTNIPVISNSMPMKNVPFAGYASSEISAPTPKLTLDPKNELTLDSRTVGLDGTDELALEGLLTRESFLTTFAWDTILNPNTRIWTSLVAPHFMFRYNNSRMWRTPMAHIADMYQYWTGSMIFRFVIVATQYHRGRIKVSYDPSPDLVPTTSLGETTNVTHIHDIGDSTDFEITIPYMQSRAYISNPLPPLTAGAVDTGFGSNASLITNSPHRNGFLTVEVSNELTSPTVSAPVEIVVFVRAGPDMKMMGPRVPTSRVSWEAQGDISPVCPEGACDKFEFMSVDHEEPCINLVYGGESAVSLRQLLHRHCFERGFYSGTVGSVYSSVQHMYPLSFNAVSGPNNIHFDGVAYKNWVSNSFVSWISPMFAGRRGSMYWGVNVLNTGSTSDILCQVSRTLSFIPSKNTYDAEIAGPTVDSTPNYAYSLFKTQIPVMGNGGAITNTKTQAGFTWLFPYISNRRFSSTKVFFQDNANINKEAMAVELHGLQTTTGINRMNGMYYNAAGPDFNLFFFTGVPTVRITGAGLPS